MSVGRIFEKTRAVSKTLFLIPLALFLFVFSVLFSPFMTEGYVEGEGIVTDVKENYSTDADGDRVTEYDNYFSYEVDGKTYEACYTLGEKKEVGSTITFYYDPENPERTSNAMNNDWLWLIFAGLGVAVIIFAIVSAVKDHNRGIRTDELRAKQASEQGGYRPENIDLTALTEYYFRFDGRAFMPGYLIEDKFRTPVFEGKLIKNFPFTPRKFTFTDSRTHNSVDHSVTHVVSGGTDDWGMFSYSSRFKFDGVDIWDYLHEKGVLINTGFLDGLTQAVYDITLNGKFLARAAMTSIYVHEEDEEGKKIRLPNKMYYRIWTASGDLELIFTTVFAIAETGQLVYS